MQNDPQDTTAQATGQDTAPTAPPASIGRVVWYYPSRNDTGARNGEQPHTAQIATVWGPAMVNLAVHDANGVPYAKTSIALYHPDAVPDWQQAQGGYATWMPYQVQGR